MPPTAPSAADRAVTDRESASSAGIRALSRSTGPVSPPLHRRAFPREARLLDGRAYDTVFASNRRLTDRYWTVLVHAVPDKRGEPSLADARLGLAIAKKRARRAVDRNRIKRVARESFRHARTALVGHHVVVMNRDAAAMAGALELRRALDALWSRMLRQSDDERERRGHRHTGTEEGRGGSDGRAGHDGRKRPAGGTAAGSTRR